MTRQYLYVMSDGQYAKIGISSQPNRRACALKFAFGKPISKFKLWECRRARLVEREVKISLIDNVVIGTEWFDVSPEKLASVAEEAAKRIGVDLVEKGWEKTDNSTRFTFSVTAPQIEYLSDESDKLGVSVSEVMRRIIDDYCGKNPLAA